MMAMSGDGMPQTTDFSGKVISITITGQDVSHDLVDPRFDLQAGRMFIVGSTPKGATESGWAVGALCAVAWDRVTDYFLFESLEQYEKATRISAEFHENDEK